MIPIAARIKYRRNPLRIPGKPWQPPYVLDALAHAQEEGVLTESVRGREIRISVRLRRKWTILLGLAEGAACDDADFQRAFAQVRSAARFFDCALKVAVCVAVLYFAWEIGSCFLPGGAVDRVIGGWK